MARHGRKRGLTPATLLMWVIVAGFLAALIVTRWGLDIYGEQLLHWLQANGWLS